MLKNLLFKSWLLMLCLLGAGSAWATEVTFEPGDFTATTSANYSLTKEDITVSVTSSTVNADQMRIFKSQKITFTAAAGNITGIVFTCTAEGTAKYGPGCFAEQTGYSYDGVTGTWAGSATEVSFTASNNQVRCTKIVVTYEADDNVSASPSISGEESFLTSTEVTITAADGAAIYYTTDGTDPTENSNKYTAAFSLTETTTVKAIAVEDGKDASAVVSKVFTKYDVMSSLDDFLTDATESGWTGFVKLTDAMVTYVYADKKIAYLQDDVRGVYLYGCADNLAAGDVFNGIMQVTGFSIYNNLPEITKFTLMDGYTKTSEDLVTPEEVTIEDLQANYEEYISRYIVIKDATITAFSSKNATLEQDGFSITVRDQVGSLTATEGATVDVYCFPSIFKDTKQLAVWEQSQIVETSVVKVDPTINVQDVTTYVTKTYTIDDSEFKCGDITVTSSNEAVASVEDLTITTKAVGTVTITITAAESDAYNAGSESFTLTVAPTEGEAYGDVVNDVFFESFDKCSTKGGNDDLWDQGSGTLITDNATGIEFSEKAYGAYQCARLGTGSAQGSATITVATEVGKTYTLGFLAAPWNEEASTVMTVDVEGGSISGISEDAMEAQKWNVYEGTIVAETEEMVIVIASTGSKRFFLDEIYVYESIDSESVTLNAKGYATHTSRFPIDFAAASGFTAWEVASINGSTITFNQVTDAIKGGEGVLLKGAANATVELPFTDCSTTLDNNLLEGILDPTYVEAGQYYGLSGDTFAKINEGVVAGGKALIDASIVTSDAKGLTLVFNGADGIQTIENVTAEEAAQIFDLNGRRLAEPRKGVNIIGGKKVLVK